MRATETAWLIRIVQAAKTGIAVETTGSGIRSEIFPATEETMLTMLPRPEEVLVTTGIFKLWQEAFR